MNESVRVYIERLKVHFGVRSDEQLGAILGVKKQSVSSWRRRNKIPLAIELKLVQSNGAQFAWSNETRKLSENRENQIAAAASLYCLIERGLDNPFMSEPVNLLRHGNILNDLMSDFKKLIRENDLDLERESALKALIRMYNRRELKQINAILLQ
ncbi:MAG: helix-turn-helix domain-containing protein [Roseibium sp.]